MSLSIPYDAVLFDLDGTLVATDRFWPQAARAGALLAFEELGLERLWRVRGWGIGTILLTQHLVARGRLDEAMNAAAIEPARR